MLMHSWRRQLLLDVFKNVDWFNFLFIKECPTQKKWHLSGNEIKSFLKRSELIKFSSAGTDRFYFPVYWNIRLYNKAVDMNGSSFLVLKTKKSYFPHNFSNLWKWKEDCLLFLSKYWVSVFWVFSRKSELLRLSDLCLLQLRFMGNVDVDRVSSLFRDALVSFMSRRNSPLTTQMFTDLFTRFPVSPDARLLLETRLFVRQGAVNIYRNHFCASCPGFMCEPVGHGCAAHLVCSSRSSTGKTETGSKNKRVKWITVSSWVRPVKALELFYQMAFSFSTIIFSICCVVNKSLRNLLSDSVTQLGTHTSLKPADTSYKSESILCFVFHSCNFLWCVFTPSTVFSVCSLISLMNVYSFNGSLNWFCSKILLPGNIFRLTKRSKRLA